MFTELAADVGPWFIGAKDGAVVLYEAVDELFKELGRTALLFPAVQLSNLC